MKFGLINNKYIFGGYLFYKTEGASGYQRPGEGVTDKGCKSSSGGYKGVDKFLKGAVLPGVDNFSGRFIYKVLPRSISGGLDLIPEFRAGPA